VPAVRTLVMTLVLLALGLTGGASVRADAPPEPVDPGAGNGEPWRKLYDEGKVHYQLREYDQAILAFKESYRQSRRPQLLFNIAQAYRLAGDCASAARFYRTFLDAAPVADPAPVEARIHQMQICAARPRPARVVPLRPPPPPRRDAWAVTGWVIAGSGVVTGIVGGYLLVAAQSRADQLAGACTPALPCDWRVVASINDARQRDQRWGEGLLVGGGLLAAAGVGIVVWRWLAPSPAAATVIDHVSLAPAPGGAVLGWSASF
jgi:tetratricopeptide (TPR) repeat protein